MHVIGPRGDSEPNLASTHRMRGEYSSTPPLPSSQTQSASCLPAATDSAIGEDLPSRCGRYRASRRGPSPESLTHISFDQRPQTNRGWSASWGGRPTRKRDTERSEGMETPYRPPTSHQSILAYDQKDPPRTLSEVFVSVYTGRCCGAQMRFGFAKGYHRIQDSLSDIFALLLN